MGGEGEWARGHTAERLSPPPFPASSSRLPQVRLKRLPRRRAAARRRCALNLHDLSLDEVLNDGGEELHNGDGAQARERHRGARKQEVARQHRQLVAKDAVGGGL